MRELSLSIYEEMLNRVGFYVWLAFILSLDE